MTRATALPVSCAPATGDWLMTEPAGTVALDRADREARIAMADEAAVCVRPTTSGTATCGTPLDTTSATALPVSTCAPAAGDWLMTEPAGTVSARLRRHRADREARLGDGRRRRRLREADDIRYRDLRDAAGHDERDRAAAIDLRARGGRLADDRTRRHRQARLRRHCADREGRLGDGRRGRRLREADDIRHRDLRHAAGHDERDRAAGIDLRTRGWATG